MTKALFDRTYPHQVELPETALRDRLQEAHTKLAMWDGQYRVEVRRPHFFSRWAFKTAEHADWFKRDFGGERIDVPEKK